MLLLPFYMSWGFGISIVLNMIHSNSVRASGRQHSRLLWNEKVDIDIDQVQTSILSQYEVA
jgi:hypothetical protein